MTLFTITFALDKETKNTVKYAAVNQFQPIDTLYIQKRDLHQAMQGKPYPQSLTVTVAEQE